MSQDLNDAYVRDPLKFMRRNFTTVCSFIDGMPARMWHNPPGHIPIRARGDGTLWNPRAEPQEPGPRCLSVRAFGTEEVEWGRRDLYADFTHAEGFEDPRVNVTFGDEGGDGRFQCWFLPWIPNALTYMRLTHDGPRYFFTSSLTGCSIWVTGQRASPIVFHGNARDLVIDGDPNIEPSAEQYQGEMDRLFDHVLPHLPENDVVRRSKLTKIHYQRHQHHQQRKAQQGRAVRSEFATESICVFGFRRGGRWHFYFQENVFMDYERPGTALYGRMKGGGRFRGVRHLVGELPPDPGA